MAFLLAPARLPAATPEIRAAATAATLAYRDAWRTNHREAVMETMTPDAVIVPSGHEPIRGDAAISAFFWPAGGLETTVTVMEQTIESIEGAGDLAIVSGQGLLSFTWTQEGRTESRTQRSTFMNVIRRLPDGDWKITQRFWSDLKAPAAAAPPASTPASAPVAPATPGAPAVPAPGVSYESAWPQFSADGRSLVFASTREEGDWEIHVIQVDGTEARRLTRSPGRDAHPYYTRDRKEILFQSPRDGGGDEGEVDLYAMDLDGGNVHRLLSAPGFDGVPVPAPAGGSIAYMHGKRTGDAYHWEIRTADARGRRDRAITGNAWSSQVPSWSPDGRRLAIFADPQGRDQLFLLDVESGKPTPLAPSPAADRTPSFSPDGRFVAFSSTRDDLAGGKRDLYRVEVATGTVTRLTTGFDAWSQPAWSPDGRRLAFSAKRAGVEEIFLLELDGGVPIRLTRGAEGWRSDDPRFKVEAAVQEYARLTRMMDAERLAAAYEVDGALVNPGMEPLLGREAIRKFLASFTGVRVTANSMSTSATEMFGDTALVWGDYAETVVVGDKPPAEFHGRFVSEWGRSANGRWLLRRLLTQPSGP
jgi:TolB protein